MSGPSRRSGDPLWRRRACAWSRACGVVSADRHVGHAHGYLCPPRGELVACLWPTVSRNSVLGSLPQAEPADL
jgi:hypothetical protein